MINTELSARSLTIRLFFCFFDGSFKVEVVDKNWSKQCFKFSCSNRTQTLFSVTHHVDECFRRKWETTSVKDPIQMQSALWAAESLKKVNIKDKWIDVEI